MTAIRNTDITVLGQAAKALTPIVEVAQAANLCDGSVWFLIGRDDFMRAGDLDATRRALGKLNREIIRRSGRTARPTTLTFLREVRAHLNNAVRAWERLQIKHAVAHVFVHGPQFLEVEHLDGLLECDRIILAEINRRYEASARKRAA